MAITIAVLLLVGFMAAYLAERVRIPGLLGMLLMGVLSGPHLLNILPSALLDVSYDLRMVALIIILLRAGLNLHREVLVQVGWTALLMAVVPVTLEGAVVAWLVHHLFALPLLEALLFASVVVAVSPAVVVPFMLACLQRRWGTNKGIPTLILTAAAVEDVFVIVLFSVLLGMQSGAEGGSLWPLLHIPEAMVLGVLSGLLMGLGLHRLFKRWSPSLFKQTLTLVALSLVLTGLEDALKPHVALSALLGVMTVGWILREKAPQVAQGMARQLTGMWTFAEVLLYVLVGAQVNIHVAWDAGLLGLMLVVLGLGVRSVAVWWCVRGQAFNRRERLFCVVAFVPKATVQAALGAIPLAQGVPSGEMILAVAVLSIVFTAPLGAIGLGYAGPRWLHKET